MGGFGPGMGQNIDPNEIFNMFFGQAADQMFGGNFGGGSSFSFSFGGPGFAFNQGHMGGHGVRRQQSQRMPQGAGFMGGSIFDFIDQLNAENSQRGPR